MRRLKLPDAEVISRYLAGETLYDLGDAYEVSHSTIQKRLIERGIPRRPRPQGRPRKSGGPLHIERAGYLVTKDRRNRPCRVHRGCYEAYNGSIPKGLIVHHINGDQLDNRVENLAAMTHSEHRKGHWRKQQEMSE